MRTWRGAFQTEEGTGIASPMVKHAHRPERILVWLEQGELSRRQKETRMEPGKDHMAYGLVLSNIMG